MKKRVPYTILDEIEARLVIAVAKFEEAASTPTVLTEDTDRRRRDEEQDRRDRVDAALRAMGRPDLTFAEADVGRKSREAGEQTAERRWGDPAAAKEAVRDLFAKLRAKYPRATKTAIELLVGRALRRSLRTVQRYLAD